MKKVLLTFVAVVFLAGASFAQGRFSIGAELALPDVEGVDMGFGGSVRYESPINDNISWMGTAGFLSIGGDGGSATLIPVNGGIKYYFTESFNGFYAAGELGITFFSADGASASEFGFAPGVGYHLGSIDIGAKYQIISDFNWIGFRVAYVLGGK